MNLNLLIVAGSSVLTAFDAEKYRGMHNIHVHK